VVTPEVAIFLRRTPCRRRPQARFMDLDGGRGILGPYKTLRMEYALGAPPTSVAMHLWAGQPRSIASGHGLHQMAGLRSVSVGRLAEVTEERL
jgi:hypothetical protein